VTPTLDTPSTPKERLPALDLLRFVAAAMVLLFHYTFRGGVDATFIGTSFPELDGFTRYGSFGVNLFFIISGFVILLTVDAGGRRPAHFAASRISRLYPAFWAAVTVTFVVCAVAGATFAVGISDYLRNLGMFPSWLRADYVDGAYWTLELELTFYLLIVAYLLFFRRRFRIEWLLLGWLLIILPLAPNELGPGRLRLALMVDAAPFFIAGCIYYLVWRSGWTRLRIGLLVGAWLTACAEAVRIADTAQRDFATPFSGLVAAAVVSLGFVVFLALVLHPAWFRFGGWRATTLGALTYPLYLVHQNIGYVVINRIAPVVGRWGAVAVAAATVLALAVVIHRMVERRYNGPFRRWLEPRLGALDRLADRVGLGARVPSRRPQPSEDG
jgi:peptidoglycan/LPS O-acetylase OafA/YrhL